MALTGNLADFSIVNILQMIKLEGKTGRLDLTEADDLVKITFDQGNIIYAESNPQKDEGRIESTLLSNYLIDQKNWDLVKKEHDDKLKPYWDILSKKINGQLLVELINRQVIDNVYTALRWKKGTYEFSQMKSIKYNPKMMSPKDVDGILMEGCRIADEWLRVAGSVPPLDTFLVKNILGEGEEESLGGKSAGARGDFKSSLEFEILTARGVTINDIEAAVLSVVGSGKTIQEILDAARQGNFITLEAVQTLLKRAVLKTSKKKGKAMLSVDNTGATTQMIAAGALAAILVFGGLWQVSQYPSSSLARAEGIMKVKNNQAQGDLKKIQRAIKVYMTLMKKPPPGISDLVSAGSLSPADTIDPWDNKYKIVIEKGSYALFSTGPDVMLSADNVYLAGG